MRIIETPFIDSALRLARDAWQKGWHERNGGNLSYRLEAEEAAAIARQLSWPSNWNSLGLSLPRLAGEHFLLTAHGSCMRTLDQAPRDNLGIITLDEKGENWALRWGLEAHGQPTSELASHMLHQAVKLEHGGQRVIYHAHPANIIALSFVLPMESRIITRELWSMMPECVMVFPQGIGLLPWMAPGGEEIAQASGRLMEEHNVVLWAQHGVFCAGYNFDDTFSLMETVEKAAEILVKVMAMGGREQGPGKNDLRKMAARLNISLNEKMLA